MTTLFISDLHIEPARPEITNQLLDFLAGEARKARALYIVGDLFDAWLGDDDPEPEKRKAIVALSGLRETGVPLFFTRGNRDFLVGEEFARDSGCELLEDPAVIRLYGQDVLLMHGDLLCTDDVEYQAFRGMVRDPDWQRKMLSLPLAQRQAIAAELRARTQASVAGKREEIMDVNQQTVEKTMREFGITTLLHGHTHRPAVHRFTLDGAEATRIVLGDWYTQGSLVRWNAAGPELVSLPR